jgi:hypothetical protein
MVSVSATTAKAINDYRFEHRIKTESEAIRRLIAAGLEQLASKPDSVKSLAPEAPAALAPFGP